MHNGPELWQPSERIYFEEGRLETADEHVPEYLRLSQAERELMERRKREAQERQKGEAQEEVLCRSGHDGNGI